MQIRLCSARVRRGGAIKHMVMKISRAGLGKRTERSSGGGSGVESATAGVPYIVSYLYFVYIIIVTVRRDLFSR